MTDKQRMEAIDIVDAVFRSAIGTSRTIDTVDEYVQYETVAMFIDKLRILARSTRTNKAIEIARIIDEELDKRRIIGLPFLDEEN